VRGGVREERRGYAEGREEERERKIKKQKGYKGESEKTSQPWGQQHTGDGSETILQQYDQRL
jgi:hypothetical protein